MARQTDFGTCQTTVMRSRLLLAVAVLAVFYPSSRGQQQTPLPETCDTAGQPGRTQSLSVLNASQLAAGGLVAPTLASWDFEGSQGLIRAENGTNVTLSCLTAVNVSMSNPTSARSFLQPTAIDVSYASGLVIQGVTLNTDCGTVLSYQTYFCSSYKLTGSLTVAPGTVHFTYWQDGFTLLRNVTLTCPAASWAPQPPCALAAVQTAQQLLDAFGAAAVADANVTIVITTHVSITNSSWPKSPVEFAGNVTLVGSALLPRPVLDFNLMVGLWEMLPTANVSIVSLTLVNLAPTYFTTAWTQSMFAVLTMRVWAFTRYQRQLHIVNSTLVVPAEELAYNRYWITFLVSPVPEAQAKAAWLSVVDIKMLAVNVTGLYYVWIGTFTSTSSNMRLTDTLEGYPLLSERTGLRQLLNNSVPLSAARQVMNASDLLYTLAPNYTDPDDQGRRWQLFVANFSMTDPGGLSKAANGSKGGSVTLPCSIVFTRGAGLAAVRLGLGGVVDAIQVVDRYTFGIRQLILDELVPYGSVYDAQKPLHALSSPLWNVALMGAGSRISLENCTLLVTAQELALLQQCLLSGDALLGLPSISFNSALMSAVKAFFTYNSEISIASYGPSYITVDAGSTQRYDILGVTYRLPVAADGEQGPADVTLHVAAPSSGFAGWKVGVTVGVIVGVVLLAAIAAAVLVVRRRRRRAGYASDGSQSAYEKYLRDNAEQAEREKQQRDARGSGTGGSDLALNPSNELTNSSQVLRPGGRNSSDLATGGFRVLKLDPTTPPSACASGAIYQAIRSSGSNDASRSMGLQGSGSGVLVTGGPSGSHSASSGALRAPAARSAAALGSPFATTATGMSSRDPATGPTTDSFERPPSASVLGQHGPGQTDRRGSNAPGSGSAATGSVPLAGMGQGSLLASAGTVGLEQMHQMIQVLGRDFNDKQLEIQGMLGKGAHGTVYRGRWRGLQVAIKSMTFSSESSVRQQQRPLMEAAISSNLVHPNIVTTYAYELREVEHEMAALSPELARQGGGWRLLIIQEYCDAGPLRRIVDCGFFLTPATTSPPPVRTKLPSIGFLRKEPQPRSSITGGNPSQSSTGGTATGTAGQLRRESAASAASSSSRGSSGNTTPVHEVAMVVSHGSSQQAGRGGGPPGSGVGSGPQEPSEHQTGRPPLDDVPPDVPQRPASSLQAALRYVEAALMIARGLQHIHDKHIVHGDLNPNNVLLVRAPDSPLGFCLKVADFGLSVRMSEGESHLSNLFQGSPFYCAPEVVMSGKIGKPADIYSLGIMLWELQNGTRPLWRMGVRLRTYPSLNTGELDFNPDTPPRYTRLARDCFHGSKDARPAIGYVVETLASVKAELESLCRG